MTDRTIHKPQEQTSGQSAEEIQAGAQSIAESDEKSLNMPETLEDIVARKEPENTKGLMTPDIALVSGDEMPDTGAVPMAGERARFNKFAKIALLLTLLAWALLILPWANVGFVSLAVAACAIASSILGIKSPKGGWRDISISSLIASAVLALILLAIIIVFCLVL